MKYIRYVYAYLFFGIGILLVDLITYSVFGPDYFSIKAELTTNWLVASIMFAAVLIPTYILGAACLILAGRFGDVDLARPLLALFGWAFGSGIIIATIPVLAFMSGSALGEILSGPLLMTWLPIVVTSLAYFVISKYI